MFVKFADCGQRALERAAVERAQARQPFRAGQIGPLKGQAEQGKQSLALLGEQERIESAIPFAERPYFQQKSERATESGWKSTSAKRFLNDSRVGKGALGSAGRRISFSDIEGIVSGKASQDEMAMLGILRR